MPDYMAFVYWMYLIPATLAALLGVLAVERGLMPEKLAATSKNNQYFNVLFQACFPLFNIGFGLLFLMMNLGGNRRS